MSKSTTNKMIKGKKKRFFQLEELLLKEQDLEFVIAQGDLYANDIQFKHGEVLPGERAYIITHKVVQAKPFYKKQLVHLRYTSSLKIVNNLEESRPLKKVPVAKIIRSKTGIYFIVDREKVTQSYYQRKQRNQIPRVIAEETFRNY